MGRIDSRVAWPPDGFTVSREGKWLVLQCSIDGDHAHRIDTEWYSQLGIEQIANAWCPEHARVWHTVPSGEPE